MMFIMRVLHVCSDTAYGCLAAVSELAAAQASLGMNVQVAILQERGRHVSEFRRRRMHLSGVTTHVLPLPKLRSWMRPRFIARGVGISAVISRLLQCTDDCDLIHGHDSLSCVYAYLAARRLAVPAVGTRHGVEPGALRPLVWRSLAPRLDGYVSLIAASEHQRLVMDSRSGENALGNGIDAAVWRKMVREATNLRESLGIDPKHFVIGLIGRLVHEKQQVSVLRALSCHLRGRNVVHVLVIGDGPQRSELQKLVETLAWEDRVHVLGFVDDMPAVYSTLDLLLMASIRESQSMVIIEAMASGVPIVATTVGSTPWLLANGAGWLFSPFDPKGLNEAIQALRKESELRQDLIARARSRVETHLNSTATARKYMDRLYYPALGHDPIAQDLRNP